MRSNKLVAAILATALVAPIAAPTFAQTVAAGEVQMAESLGVEPGLYSLEQLAELQTLTEDDTTMSQQKIDEIKSNPMGPLAAVSPEAAPTGLTTGEIQMAELIGVEPGAYTLDELAILADTQEQPSMKSLYRAVLNGELDMSTTNDRGIVTPAKEQLAGTLDVNPADYTTEELAELALAQSDENGGLTSD